MRNIHYWFGYDADEKYEDIMSLDDDATDNDIVTELENNFYAWAQDSYDGDEDNQTEWEDYISRIWYDWEEIDDTDAEVIRYYLFDRNISFENS